MDKIELFTLDYKDKLNETKLKHSPLIHSRMDFFSFLVYDPKYHF